MKYNKKLFNLSSGICDTVEGFNDTNDKDIKEKQERVLELLIEKFKEQLKNEKNPEKGFLKATFKKIFYSDFNDGYCEIDELLKGNAFAALAKDYGIYLVDAEHTCDEWSNAHYDVIWDYRDYYEQLNKSKNNSSIDLPYPVGSYVTTNENGILHIDQVHQYVYDREGLGVILELDVLCSPRLSTRIDIEKFLSNWNLYDVSKEVTQERQKQL